MASDINQVTLIGRLTRDCELKYSSGGMAIGKLSLAVNRRTKKGEAWVDEASFFDVAIFGKQAEGLNQYLLKGTQIAVVGELKQDRWEQDGQKRSNVNIAANNIQLLAKAGGYAESRGSQGRPDTNQQPPEYGGSSGFDDDIPF